MKKQVTICNRCESLVEVIHTEFSLFNERRMDAAGSCENWYWVADLCSSCTKILVSKLLKIAENWPQDQRKALAVEFKAIEQ